MLEQTDIWKLRQMQSDIRRIMQGTDQSFASEYSGQHYLVKAPSGGLPAASGTTPGEAVCTLVRRWGSGTKVLTDSTQAIKVYNSTAFPISEDETVMVHQDAWGDWYAIPQGGARAVYIKNDTGSAWVQGRVVEVTGSLETPTGDLTAFRYNDPVLLGDTPQEWANTKKFVILAEDIAAGEIGECFASGVAPALIYSDYKDVPLFANVYDNQVYLRAEYDQSNYGFPILYRETGTGSKWGLVLMSMNNMNKSISIYFNGTWSAINAGATEAERWITPTTIVKNTLVRTLSESTGFKMDGPSAWYITWHGSVEITYTPTLVSGSTYKVPEVWFDIRLNMVADDIDVYSRTAKCSHKNAAFLVSGSSDVVEQKPIMGTALVQSAYGLYEDRLSRLRFLVNCTSSGSVTIDIKDLHVAMIEVDPLAIPREDPHGDPVIALDPETFTKSIGQGETATSDTFTVRNSGPGGTLSYSISDDAAWLSCSPTSGTSTGESDTITITYSTSGLAVGSYTGTITVSDSGATNSPQTVVVSLDVGPA